MKVRTAAATAVVIAALVGILGATPANAAAGDCPSGDACIWREAAYVTGTNGRDYIRFAQSIYNYIPQTYRDGGSGNDTADSVYNNGRYESVRFYEHWFHGGQYFTLTKGTGDNNLNNTTGAVAQNWHDRVSSGYFASFWP